MLSKDLEFSINLAFREARDRRHEFMTIEHLLLALLDIQRRRRFAGLRRSSGQTETRFADLYSRQHADSAGGRPTRDQPTLGFQRVLQRAVLHVQSSGHREVTGANVLVALFGEQESQAVYLLKQQEINRAGRGELHLARHLQGGRRAGIRHAPGRGNRREPERQAAGRFRQQSQRTGAAGSHRSADRPPRGSRAHHSDSCRRRKNNPLFVARPGSARPPSPRAWPR